MPEDRLRRPWIAQKGAKCYGAKTGRGCPLRAGLSFVGLLPLRVAQLECLYRCDAWSHAGEKLALAWEHRERALEHVQPLGTYLATSADATGSTAGILTGEQVHARRGSTFGSQAFALGAHCKRSFDSPLHARLYVRCVCHIGHRSRSCVADVSCLPQLHPEHVCMPA